mgnify:FL=1
MLYYKYYNDKKSEYNKLFKEAINIRMSQDIQVKQKCLDILGYRNIILLKIQSLFYFEKKTHNVLNFREWIIKKIKKKDLNAELSIILFFDGLIYYT